MLSAQSAGSRKEVVSYQLIVSQIYYYVNKNIHPMQLKLNQRDLQIAREDSSLREYAYEMLRREEEVITYKMQQEEERSRRIKDLQSRFCEWSQKKSIQYSKKMQNSKKLKTQHLEKIVKRCKDRQKMVKKKSQDYKIRKNHSLNEAWRKAEEFNHDLLNYQQSKNIAKRKQHHDPSQTKSIPLGQPDAQENEPHQKKFNQSMNIINTGHGYKGNFSHAFYNYTDHIDYKSYGEEAQDIQENIEEDKKDKYEKKIEQARRRGELIENQKLQKLGEKLTKIEKSRIKKRELLMKKKSHTESSVQKNYPQKQQRYEFKPQKQLFLTAYAQKQKGFQDRDTNARNKRKQAFEQHLQNGNAYLKKLKMKHLKTILCKNITFNAMEKKLYYDRLKN